jgi:hypothetical protein
VHILLNIISLQRSPSGGDLKTAMWIVMMTLLERPRLNHRNEDSLEDPRSLIKAESGITLGRGIL